MSSKLKPKTKYQNVIITLSNGKVGTFTGAVIADSKDQGKATITNIVFTEPKDLPEGFTLEKFA